MGIEEKHLILYQNNIKNNPSVAKILEIDTRKCKIEAHLESIIKQALEFTVN